MFGIHAAYKIRLIVSPATNLDAAYMRTLFVVGTCIVLGLAIGLLWHFRMKIRNSRAFSLQASESSPTGVYADLRNRVLDRPRAEFNLPAEPYPTEPWGVVMDWALDSGYVTVAALSDGNASVYLSSGGGPIGGRLHESIREAAEKMVAAAAEVQSRMDATTTHPLPQNGEVVFYLRTDAGLFTAKDTVTDLSSQRSPFSKLGNAAQEIITRYRNISRKNDVYPKLRIQPGLFRLAGRRPSNPICHPRSPSRLYIPFPPRPWRRVPRRVTWDSRSTRQSPRPLPARVSGQPLGGCRGAHSPLPANAPARTPWARAFPLV